MDQRPVTKTELRPYLAMARQRMEGNSENPAWGKLEARWGRLGDEGARVVAAFERGRPAVSWEVLAARDLTRQVALVDARAALETTSAMVLMQQLDPRRFRSDAAFKAQLVRRVRGLTEANTQTTHDWRTGKVRKSYLELPPRAVQVLGQWIVEALGIAGVHMARLEVAERDARAQERDALHAGLEGLK